MKLPEPLEQLFGLAMKRAEKTLQNSKQLSELVDSAFDKLGDNSNIFIEIQEKTKAMFRLVKSFATRKYSDVNPKTIIVAVGAIIYLLNPLDFVPDFIPVAGLMDDLTIVTYVLTLINDEVDKFTKWEQGQPEDIEILEKS